jgi:small subunit ribosomal protein S6e
MVFKINISEKGKTYKVESESESLIGKKIGEIISGSEISGDLAGYELEVKGTSDKAGFPGIGSEKGGNLRKVMFTKGSFFHKVKNKGVRKKKNVRGNEISIDTRQINTIVKKEGGKKLEDVFKKEEAVEAVASA